MDKALLYTLPGERAAALANALCKSYELYLVKPLNGLDFPIVGDLAQEDQKLLILAFPDPVQDDTAFAQILDSSFLISQSFVQTRMRKKSGGILALVDVRATGIATSEESIESLSLVAQGGLVGLMKTIAREYGKRSLSANSLYIDWSSIAVDDVVSLVKALPIIDSNKLQGQVFALDGGKWL
ncbi:MAG: hypothetical protein SFT81_05400 [Candidatus Caenarcaniphilales bacterium]|nr:hypothetical protein [Candidatus Caenarcaniphilales bacterium]